MLILDKVPEVCADSTPYSLYEYILKSIREGVSLSKSPSLCGKAPQYTSNKLSDLISKDILYSKNNRNYICAYYNQLARNYKKRTGNKKQHNILIPERVFTPEVNLAEYLLNPLLLHSPAIDSTYMDLYKRYKESLDMYAVDQVAFSRALLILMEPTDDEFVSGIPAWYRSLNDNYYTGFDPVTKRHIKIVKNENGKYSYYIGYISNCMKEIRNVPEDMKYVVEHLIHQKDINFD